MKTLVSVVLVVAPVALSGCERPMSPPELSDQVLVQAEKVFSSVQDAEQEFQRLFSETKYPNDPEKNAAAKWFSEKEAAFNIIRIDYIDIKEKRTREALTNFVASAWQFVASPEATFTHYDFRDSKLKDGKEIYANLSKIESIVGEFRVFAVSALKEVR